MSSLVDFVAEACCWPNSLSATRRLLSTAQSYKRKAPTMAWARSIPAAFKGVLSSGPAAYWILAHYTVGACLYGECCGLAEWGCSNLTRRLSM